MKKESTKSRNIRGLAPYILPLMILGSLVGCSKKISFLVSPAVPAARGYVDIKTDKNKNNVIKVYLTDLAEVERLEPTHQTYVIWMLTDQSVIKNIGQIKSSAGSVSKQLKASFETVSSFKPVKIFITAEDNADVQYPGNQMVLETEKFNK